MSSPWPHIDYGYQDPEGYIDLDVYNAAGAMLAVAETFAAMTLGDEAAGRVLLFKAAARVTERHAKGHDAIRNLSAYLYITYRRLVGQEQKRLKLEESYDEGVFDALVVKFGGGAAFGEDVARSVERRICVEQIVSRMDDWTREVFQWRVLGHSFEDIGRARGVPSNGIRSKFHKELKWLARSLGAGTTVADDEGADDPAP